jgi:MFS transporter, FHS family, L-fucose permease
MFLCLVKIENLNIFAGYKILMNVTQKSGIPPILILGALFFIFGFVTWLNGTLIPYLKIACELNNFESLLVAFAFYISYFVMALPSSLVLKRTGFRKGMMYGLLVMAVGALLFIPAALTRTYGLFLTGLFVIGTGLSVLQTASNPYITIVGPIESAARRISIMGICNKVAGVLAPIILGMIVLADADALTAELQQLTGTALQSRLDELASRVIVPYLVMALVLMGLSMMIYFSPLPEIEEEKENTEDLNDVKRKSVLSFPNLVLGVIALFFYVGVEVIAGDTIGTYGQSLGIPLSEAKYFTAYTLTGMVIGYLLGIATIPRYVSQSTALAISAVTGIVFSLISIHTDGYTSVLFIALLGLANALMWPAIWPLAIDGLGSYIKTASALLIMAIAGGALLPLVYGHFADQPDIGHKQAYWVMVPCYVFILYYSIKGWKIRKW